MATITISNVVTKGLTEVLEVVIASSCLLNIKKSSGNYILNQLHFINLYILTYK